MNLKPQDVFVLLKLATLAGEDWSYASLALSLGMSTSEVHASLKRSMQAGLAINAHYSVTPNYRNFTEFLLHGVRFCFVPELGGLVRGMPTAQAASPLQQHFIGDEALPPVWPDPAGEVRGLSLSPLYRSVPQAARQDKPLYELLALTDAIRGGRARERALASQLLQERLEAHATTES